MSGSRYLAVPVKGPDWKPDGWRVYPLPMGNGARPSGTYRGPFAAWRAKRRASALNRRGQR